jgi:phage I-like protein
MSGVVSRLIVASLGDEPPTEFRLFKAGPNKINGKVFQFDQEAASALMAAYVEQGTDVMIDLEHYAVKEDPRAWAREDAPDARGWAQLELRMGELWAVNVKWTPDGERRIREKTQRYVSPAFHADKDTGRIVQLVNIAMVAMPGTHSAPALVAATSDNRFTEPVSVRAKRYIDNVRQQKHANR